jgi:hypothetical protein
MNKLKDCCVFADNSKLNFVEDMKERIYYKPFSA